MSEDIFYCPCGKEIACRLVCTRLKAEKARAEKAEAAYRKAMLALEGLTPGGSEYVGDPERCTAHLRNQRTHLNDLLKKIILGKRELRAEIMALEHELADTKADLETNAALLAKQTDLAREAKIGKVKAEERERRLREVHAILASLAGLLRYEAAERVFFVREVDLFRDKTIGPKLSAGKPLLEILNEALAAKEDDSDA